MPRLSLQGGYRVSVWGDAVADVGSLAAAATHSGTLTTATVKMLPAYMLPIQAHADSSVLPQV